MSYSSVTPILGLPQYAGTDRLTRDEVNAILVTLDGIASPLEISGVYMASLVALQAAHPSGDTIAYVVDGVGIYRWLGGAWRSIGIDLSGYYNKSQIDALVTTINSKVMPAGGSTGQALRKTSGTDYSAGWAAVHELPAGGASGKVLKKASAADYDAAWGDVSGLPTGGTLGQFLRKASTTDGDAAWADLWAQALTGLSTGSTLANLAATDTMLQALAKLMYWYTAGGAGILQQSTAAGARTTLGIAMLTATYDCYISPSGNDTTGTGTSGAPWATFQKALDSIPTFMNGNLAYIHTAAGTYSAGATAWGKTGGVVIINPDSNTIVINGDLIFNACSAVLLMGTVTINTAASSAGGLRARYNATVTINSTLTVNGGGSGVGILAELGGKVAASSGITITINNATVALKAVCTDIEMGALLAGSGNTTGRLADGGIIITGTVSLTATTATSKLNNGQIYP